MHTPGHTPAPVRTPTETGALAPPCPPPPSDTTTLPLSTEAATNHATRTSMSAIRTPARPTRAPSPPSTPIVPLPLAPTGEFAGKPTRWVGGLQLAALSERSGASERCAVLGHAAVGGSVGLCVPARQIAIAITVSALADEPIATRRLLKAIL
eukprot:6175227-Pleurochrysis_carterae.AAC.1